MEIYKEGCKNATITKQIQKVCKCYPDGIWGPKTTEAVRAFQRANGLKDDGIVGPATLAKMGLSAAVQAVTPAKQQASIGHSGIVLKKSKRTINEIIVHCTASREGQAQTVEQIRANHMAPVSKGGRGWSDIGYHYVIYLDGSVHIGRDVDLSGAHCTNHNAHSIGVAYVGGLENKPNTPYSQLKAKDTRTDAQKAALMSLLMDLRKLYPQASIHGHRDFSSKACPSFDARAAYRNI